MATNKPNDIRLREIPYNYTSYTDREIVIRLLDEENWELIQKLRQARNTGISARMIFEILGDIWIILRNPFLQDDLFKNDKRWKALTKALHHRLDQVVARTNENKSAIELSVKVRETIHWFRNWFRSQKALRVKTFASLKKVTHKDNIRFDGLSRVSHSSDASDWRVENPFVVITPDSEKEVLYIVRSCIKLGLTIIPRGGGTGYTGSSVPLYANTAMINTEKLISLEGINDYTSEDGETHKCAHTGAGLVTKRVSELAEANGLVFAVDPTSQTASTIGGNIAMNAGGKKAVLWGTTIDNLLSWKMVNPMGEWMRIDRLKHNRGKIHEQKLVTFRIVKLKDDGQTETEEEQILEIEGSSFRKAGLGKDVTDKFLKGLPGVQKEGCDGIITSADFILHKKADFTFTICLEFFGHDLNKSVPAIVEVIGEIKKSSHVQLAGLEHLDERYVKAIKYNTKASRGELPKMVLLGDLISDDEKILLKVVDKVKKLAQARDAECFIAVTAQARRNFWLDRSRTAAIAAHTNAFKINEDVVIPLDKLIEYNEGIESINIEYSIKNKLEIAGSQLDYLQGPMPEVSQLRSYESSIERDEIIKAKKAEAQKKLKTVQTRWKEILKNLEKPAAKNSKLFNTEEKKSIQKGDRVKDLFLRRDISVSYKNEMQKMLQEIFNGSELEAVRKKFNEIHIEAKTGRLFIATHMHAGDGNVHTNIPVNSHKNDMMKGAHEIVHRVMKLAKSLNGVISGEHGIGLTKFQYLDKDIKRNFAAYKNQVDPDGHFNKGKLLQGADLQGAYTPSLNLVQQEAIIMEHSELGELNNAIKHCLRCGKCKPVCTTHVPQANLLYAPRNKILGTGLLIEAFIYEEQTRRGLSLQHFDEFNDIADHCTVCHNCYKPCPVNIDFGNVSITMRSILKNKKLKKSSMVASLALSFLNISSPVWIKILRQFVLRPGFIAQRTFHKMFRNTQLLAGEKIPASTTGKMSLRSQLTNTLKKPLPVLPKETLRGALGIEDSKYISIIRDPEKVKNNSEAVFFFLGCGVERLYTKEGFAALALLYDLGIQIILPPAYTCCGAPQAAHGDLKLSKQLTSDNRVLFHRVSNTLNYLDIKTVLTICGTCIDQLGTYEFDKIFPGSRLIDIHEYILEKKVTLKGKQKEKYIYHDPCHTPIKNQEPINVARKLVGKDVILSDRCCAESGTFAVARPDIATQSRFSKLGVLRQNVQDATGKKKASNGELKLLTTCPSCLQGLARYANDTGAEPAYLITEVVNHRMGKNWQKEMIKKIKTNGIEKILL
ncbi:MAG: DUF3683 domain-containing protein [Leptospirales bacterium]